MRRGTFGFFLHYQSDRESMVQRLVDDRRGPHYRVFAVRKLDYGRTGDWGAGAELIRCHCLQVQLAVGAGTVQAPRMSSSHPE